MEETFKCYSCGCETSNSEVYSCQGCNDIVIHMCDSCKERFGKGVEFQADGKTCMEPVPICPWCRSKIDYAEVMHGDADGIPCPHCGKRLDLDVSILYSTRRSLCEMTDE